MSDKEIPEELFRKDFGGKDFERRRDDQRSDKIVVITINGLLFAILGPAILAIIAAVIAYGYYCNWGWGAACKF